MPLCVLVYYNTLTGAYSYWCWYVAFFVILLYLINPLIQKFNKTKKFSNFEKLIAQSLLRYIKVFENQSHDYETELSIIPKNYENFVLINDAFINCYLDNKKVEERFT